MVSWQGSAHHARASWLSQGLSSSKQQRLAGERAAAAVAETAANSSAALLVALDVRDRRIADLERNLQTLSLRDEIT
eukprot:SAG11_NODE_13456_length_654_cov_1.751351_2_plen_77_part_00